MPVRGIAVDFPSWWLAALASLMAPQPDGSPGVTKTQLAEALIPKTATGPARVRALNAARVKVSRFFDDKEPSRTVEIADAWCAEFGLPRFRYEATSRKMALAVTRHDLHGRRLRAASAAEYERALRHLMRSLLASAVLAPNGCRVVDLTADSSDELRFT